jgi:hypothetical protein
MGTKVSEEYIAFIFRAEDGGSMYLQNVGPTYKPKRSYNPEDYHEHTTRMSTGSVRKDILQ